MSDIRQMAARSGKVIRSDNTVVNEADGINNDGSRNVNITGTYKGFSNDPKPVIENEAPGTLNVFLELDTKSIYIWHDSEWVLFL